MTKQGQSYLCTDRDKQYKVSANAHHIRQGQVALVFDKFGQSHRSRLSMKANIITPTLLLSTAVAEVRVPYSDVQSMTALSSMSRSYIRYRLNPDTTYGLFPIGTGAEVEAVIEYIVQWAL